VGFKPYPRFVVDYSDRLLVAGQPLYASSVGFIWIGNDTIGNVYELTTSGTVVTTLPSLPTTGIASNGSSLFLADRVANITQRTPNGMTILNSFTTLTGDTGEDMAWDSTRGVLWEVDHADTLLKINSSNGAIINSNTLPNTDPMLGSIGALGLAYDHTRDLLYVSFCQTGCASFNFGLVETVDPNTGTVLSVLFRTTGFPTGGLGYDPSTDTLWVGSQDLIRNMTLTGTVLSSFSIPPGNGFADGLEFVPIPEPGTLLMLGTGIVAAFAVVHGKERL
jgi:hypothetical protein